MNIPVKPGLLFPVKYGLYIGGVIILFQVFSHLVIYNMLKMDYYLAAVALLFLFTGLRLRKTDVITKEVIIVKKEIVEIDKEVIKEVFVEKPAAETREIDLTSKEIQVLGQIASGMTNKEIAELNCVELSTVKTHINNLYAKLGVRNRREAIRIHATLAKTG